jgi:hypothetical protein
MHHVRRLGVPAGGAILLLAVAASAVAKTPALPPSGKLTKCHQTVYKMDNRYPVKTDYGKQKGQHPKQSLLSCKNSDAVAAKGKKYFDKTPFGVGKKVQVSGVTYTLEETHGASYDGHPLSGPMYGWVGGGVVILLEQG